MAVRSILRYPDPFLRKRTEPWVFGDDSLLDSLWDDIEDTLEASDHGAALAANQVGIPYRMFVTNQLLTARSEDTVDRGIPPLVVNPKIVSHGQRRTSVEEGCLSFPGLTMQVLRYDEVTVEYETVLKGVGPLGKEPWRTFPHLKETRQLRGFWSQVFQHETDHLDGKLFVDHLPVKKRLEIAALMRGRNT